MTYPVTFVGAHGVAVLEPVTSTSNATEIMGLFVHGPGIYCINRRCVSVFGYETFEELCEIAREFVKGKV